MKPKIFKSKSGNLPLPIFFPDATRAVVKTVDSNDIVNTKTPGILVNTYHLYRELGSRVIKKFGGVGGFMGWESAIISDSGGFQVMSLAKTAVARGKITDHGVTFKPVGSKKITLTPADSIKFQFAMETDLMVVLDDFTPPGAGRNTARDTVERTILWAKKCKEEYLKLCRIKKFNESNRPYLIGVVQGGEDLELRKECTQRLVEIGFDGLGYGGWPMGSDGLFNYDVAKVIAENSPDDYLLYGLGIGKPHEIVALVDMGYSIFDCVLPTRDARHKRLYVYNADSIEQIDVRKPDFYSYYTPDKEKHYYSDEPISSACDCLLCKKYSRAYLAHLFRIKDTTSMRLSTIHNLRFYSTLMEKLRL
jgi:queuine tRNA-ribosyltransferase